MELPIRMIRLPADLHPDRSMWKRGVNLILQLPEEGQKTRRFSSVREFQAVRL